MKMSVIITGEIEAPEPVTARATDFFSDRPKDQTFTVNDLYDVPEVVGWLEANAQASKARLVSVCKKVGVKLPDHIDLHYGLHGAPRSNISAWYQIKA
jgi:hypothetical protein